MMDLRLSQQSKALSPMLVTEFGMTIEVNPQQSRNAISPISRTKLPISTDFKFRQPWNANLPILITLSGILTELRLAQYLNAAIPIVVTLLGIMTDVILSQNSKPHSHGAKPSSLISVTPSGITISPSASFEHFFKIPFSIVNQFGFI